MDLKIQNSGQFKLNPVPPWKSGSMKTTKTLREQTLTKLAKSLFKSGPRYRCDFHGRTVTADSEAELRRKVQSAVESDLVSSLSKIPGVTFR